VKFFYTVSCRIEDPLLETRWLGWLEREHIADVIAAGALSAEVVRRDGEGRVYDIHYRFKDSAAYDDYIENHAPRLREEGMKLFPHGLAYARTSGEIIFSR
jgi:hypothetical protein